MRHAAAASSAAGPGAVSLEQDLFGSRWPRETPAQDPWARLARPQPRPASAQQPPAATRGSAGPRSSSMLDAYGWPRASATAIPTSAIPTSAVPNSAVPSRGPRRRIAGELRFAAQSFDQQRGSSARQPERFYHSVAGGVEVDGDDDDDDDDDDDLAQFGFGEAPDTMDLNASAALFAASSAAGANAGSRTLGVFFFFLI
jgi:hypothetical protein